MKGTLRLTPEAVRRSGGNNIYRLLLFFDGKAL